MIGHDLNYMTATTRSPLKCKWLFWQTFVRVQVLIIRDKYKVRSFQVWWELYRNCIFFPSRKALVLQIYNALPSIFFNVLLSISLSHLFGYANIFSIFWLQNWCLQNGKKMFTEILFRGFRRAWPFHTFWYKIHNLRIQIFETLR